VGRATYPDVKAEGNKSMSSKRGQPEDVYGSFAPQDPHDMVRAKLHEPQFPGVQLLAPRPPRPKAGPPSNRSSSCGSEQPKSEHLAWRLSDGGRWALSPFKGTNRAPTSCYYSQQRPTTGSPTGCEPYGDGVFIVVVGVTTDQGGRESRPQGEGRQVSLTRGWGGMRNAKRQDRP
jgi:hypothetical protein